MNQSPATLRSGFTTGAAAAAAAKAALQLLLTGKAPDNVDIAFLTGERTLIAVHHCRQVTAEKAHCSVIKDAGDDPDITHGAEIGAEVTVDRQTMGQSIRISGGQGVGTVTKPGLEIPIGQSAITPGPVAMITASINEVLADHPTPVGVQVEVFAPEGERLARKTLNARLGIVGGISILGTTGIVRPMSHAAYIATIEKAMDVARATGNDHLVLTTGRRSERYAQGLWPDLPEEAFIQIGDFFQKALKAAAVRRFTSVTLAVFFGKAVKMAQNIPHTHAAAAELTLNALASWTRQLTNDPHLAQTIAEANTARHAFDPLLTKAPLVIAHVADQARRCAVLFSDRRLRVGFTLFDYEGRPVVDRRPQWD